MSRLYNFNAGPAMLPTPVLEEIQAELLDWQGKGLSFMEIGHRSQYFQDFREQCDLDCRELLGIGKQYKILFLHGGASSQFAAIPLNLLGNSATAAYLDSGHWSLKAIAEAERYCQVKIVASGADANYTEMPSPSSWQIEPSAAYLHYTPNETIGGLFIKDLPQTDLPLVADMSSCIMSEPLDVNQFSLIYAGVQKNLGPAGLAVVIIHEDLLDKAHPKTPTTLNYTLQAAADSGVNTPPTLAWYVTGKVIAWIKQSGGLSVFADLNQRKAKLLYDFIDQDDFYQNSIKPDFRSVMNIPFTLRNSDLEKSFLEKAKAAGLLGLKGHRSVGGMRASLYNAMPLAGVEALVAFMDEFKKRS